MLFANSERLLCPACLSEPYERYSIGVISPWVTELVGEHQFHSTKYLTCQECRSGWFTHNYSEHVFKCLYEDYRGENYFKIRNSWEPTYTRILNSELTSGEAWLKARKRNIVSILGKSGVNWSDFESVLDFGGGHGGVIPNFPKKYLIDSNKNISSKPGIIVLKDLKEALKLQLDLVMCCGVLEHVNNPQELLTDILKLDCDIFLFEVPSGIPMHRPKFLTSFLIRWFLSGKKFWKFLQRVERKFPLRMRHIFPLRCSEHLQFFSDKGIETLLSRSGFEIIFCDQMNPNEDLQDAQSLGFSEGITVICRRNRKS